MFLFANIHNIHQSQADLEASGQNAQRIQLGSVLCLHQERMLLSHSRWSGEHKNVQRCERLRLREEKEVFLSDGGEEKGRRSLLEVTQPS